MTRRTEEVTLPIPEGSQILHPEQVLLKLEGVDRRLDVGQLCYLTRDTSSRRREHHTFDPDSLSSDRVKAVRSFIAFLSDRLSSGAARSATIFLEGRDVVSLVNWADQKGLHDVLCDKAATESAVVDFFTEQRELVSQSRLNRNGVSNTQRIVLATLRGYFDDDSFGANIRILGSRRNDTNATQVPDAERQALLLSWADALFVSISSHLLEFRPYPLTVKTARGDTLHIVPTPFSRRRGEVDPVRRTDLRLGLVRRCSSLQG